MPNLTGTLSQLRDERRKAQMQVQKLDEAISVLERLLGRKGGRGAAGTGPKRILSAAAKRRISQAQKARWAKFRQQKKAAAA
jgi:hypothetical protein